MKTYKGIDISLFQGFPDFKKVKDDGIDFVMIKASQGSTADYLFPFKDPNFDKNVINFASTRGEIYAGCYHFLTAQTMEQAKIEMDYYLSVIKPYKYNLQLWRAIDIEIEYPTANRKLFSDIVKYCIDRIKAEGYLPLIYTQNWYIKAYFDVPNNTPLWICDINTSKFPENALVWQAGTGHIDGINGEVDINYAHHIMGDVNGDGKVNAKDVTATMKHIVNPKHIINESQADFDRDGKVNAKDVISLMKSI